MHLLHENPCFPVSEKTINPVNLYIVNGSDGCSWDPQQKAGNKEMELTQKSTFSPRITFVFLY